jgi:hypothetical protein
MQRFNYAIESLIPAHPNLYLEHCVVMAVALMSRLSASPCEFILQCEDVAVVGKEQRQQCLLRISWSEVTAFKAKRIWQTEQPKSIIERAAVAVAALLIAHLLEDGKMQVTREGERADYWLPNQQYALEISGTTQSRLLNRRHKEKTEQMLSNPLRWDGFVITCCFGKRKRLIRWSFHQQEERNDGRT